MSSTVERKLAAIMFTDIAGYTAQMSANESKAMDLLNKKESILKPLLKNHKGTFVKAIGDGTLSYFESAVNAAACAVKLQEITYDNPDLNIRAGIHIGDIVFKDDDVFGDGVNISSRLESMAPVGGVCVSKNVYDELINQDGFEGVDLGLQSLKGVGRLVGVYGLKGSKLKEPDPSDYQENKVAVHKDDEVPSITIIPFDNKGADEDIFYAYGISSDLISDVASAGVIRVAGMKEIEELGDMPFKDKAKTLNTRYVSTGTLWKMGNQFQLSIELHDTKESSIIWSDRWQEKWENLTSIKEKLSSSLLEALNTKPKVESSIANNNTEAYEYYLKAKFKLENEAMSKENVSLSRSLAEKAIELDPLFMEPRMILMSTYLGVGEFKPAIELSDEIIKLSKESNTPKYIAYGYAQKAIQCFFKMAGHIPNPENKSKDEILEEMITILNKVVDICQNNNDLKGELVGKNLMALGFQEVKRNKEALAILGDIGNIHRKVDDKMELSQNHNMIGMIYNNMGSYSNAIKYLDKELKYYAENNKNFISSMALYQKMEAVLMLGKNLKSDYLNQLFEQGEKIIGAEGDVVALNGLYTNMGLIKIIQKKYTEALDILLKSNLIGEELNTKNSGDNPLGRIDTGSAILIVFCKKMLEESISSELNDLEKRLDEDCSIDYIDGYYLYQVFGADKGKKYLEEAFKIINDMKTDLEDKALEEFCDAKYVKLISEEWGKINN